MNEKTYRVKIYSLPSKNEEKLQYFADVPVSVVSQALAFMMPHGKPVKKEEHPTNNNDTGV